MELYGFFVWFLMICFAVYSFVPKIIFLKYWFISMENLCFVQKFDVHLISRSEL